jgi:hypothetical protein
MLQEDSTRDAAQIKQILHNRATANAYTGALPNSSWGWGILQLDTVPPTIEEPVPALISDAALECNPNPFNPAIRIRVLGAAEGKSALLRLAVFDIRGQRVADLTGRLQSGIVEWNASGRPSGLYLVRLTQGLRSITKAVFLRR